MIQGHPELLPLRVIRFLLAAGLAAAAFGLAVAPIAALGQQSSPATDPAETDTAALRLVLEAERAQRRWAELGRTPAGIAALGEARAALLRVLTEFDRSEIAMQLRRKGGIEIIDEGWLSPGALDRQYELTVCLVQPEPACFLDLAIRQTQAFPANTLTDDEAASAIVRLSARLGRHDLVESWIARANDSYRVTIAAILVYSDQGDRERAIGLADSLGVPRQRAEMLLMLGKRFGIPELLDQAEAADRAGTAEDPVDTGPAPAWDLRPKLACARVKLASPPMDRVAVQQISDELSRRMALSCLATVEADAGRTEAAAALVDAALEGASPSDRSLIGHELARAGQATLVERVWDGLAPVDQAWLLSALATELARSGDIEGATDVARRLQNLGADPNTVNAHDSALLDIAAAQFRKGDIAGGRQSARAISDPQLRALAYSVAIETLREDELAKGAELRADFRAALAEAGEGARRIAAIDGAAVEAAVGSLETAQAEAMRLEPDLRGAALAAIGSALLRKK